MIEVSLYGNKRKITFEELQLSSMNIDLAKTKISIDNNNLMQKVETTNTLKGNILSDYIKGISKGFVTISCSDYYNQANQKSVDWQKGDVVQVDNVIYFENDKYLNGKQRYWKVKGRTFRKQGVPMIDLDLEEVNNYTINDLTWEEVKTISESGNASSMFSVGDKKDITLSNGEIITATIIDFNHDTLADSDVKAGITFAVTDYNHKSTLGGNWWYDSTMRTTTLPSIYNSIPSKIQSLIKPVKKMSVVGNDTSPFNIGETTDNLWLFSAQEVEGTWGDGTKYKYLADNLSKLVDETQNDWWLRSKPYLQGDNQYAYVKDNEVKWTTRRTEEKTIIFGFCI